MIQQSSPVIAQPETGYRYSMEPFLLAGFTSTAPGMRILDIGCGSGIIPLLLLAREPGLNLTAIEIQPELHAVAQANFRKNPRASSICLVLGDVLQNFSELETGAFDLVVSNPPYRRKNSGRINPDPIKAMARHELRLTLRELVERIRALLKPGGRAVLAYPASRLDEVVTCLRENGLPPSRLRRVFGHRASECKFFLIEAFKGEGDPPLAEETFHVYREDGAYSSEMETLYASLDHSGRSHRLRKK